MTHQDHITLLRRAVTSEGGRWADFGSGEGAFTLALRELVGSAGEIFSVDKDEARLREQQKRFRAQFPQTRIHFIHADLAHPLDLPPLDGIVAANSLHFFRNREQVLRHICGYLIEGGELVLVEYNVDTGNPWVPYPLSFESFRTLALNVGLTDPELLETVPSRFLREIYSALTFKRKPPPL